VVENYRRLGFVAEHAQISVGASGTIGMKAALMGVPSLSILGRLWVEVHIGMTGWAWRIGSSVD